MTKKICSNLRDRELELPSQKYYAESHDRRDMRVTMHAVTQRLNSMAVSYLVDGAIPNAHIPPSAFLCALKKFLELTK